MWCYVVSWDGCDVIWCDMMWYDVIWCEMWCKEPSTWWERLRNKRYRSSSGLFCPAGRSPDRSQLSGRGPGRWRPRRCWSPSPSAPPPPGRTGGRWGQHQTHTGNVVGSSRQEPRPISVGDLHINWSKVLISILLPVSICQDSSVPQNQFSFLSVTLQYNSQLKLNLISKLVEFYTEVTVVKTRTLKHSRFAVCSVLCLILISYHNQ